MGVFYVLPVDTIEYKFHNTLLLPLHWTCHLGNRFSDEKCQVQSVWLLWALHAFFWVLHAKTQVWKTQMLSIRFQPCATDWRLYMRWTYRLKQFAFSTLLSHRYHMADQRSIWHTTGMVLFCRFRTPASHLPNLTLFRGLPGVDFPGNWQREPWES